jgi:hypothetical protein
MTENEQQPTPPRSSFTFFPLEEENQWFVTASVEDIAALVDKNQDMSARVVHELWRNRRDSEIRELGAHSSLFRTHFVRIEGEDESIVALEVSDSLIADYIVSGVMAYVRHDIPKDEHIQFMRSSLMLLAAGKTDCICSRYIYR